MSAPVRESKTSFHPWTRRSFPSDVALRNLLRDTAPTARPARTQREVGRTTLTTLTTVPSMNAMLEPRIVAAKIQGRAASTLGTLVLADRSRTASQGVLINPPMLCSRLLIHLSILPAPESSSFARNPIASYDVASPSSGD
jgi:hypothetical protein